MFYFLFSISNNEVQAKNFKGIFWDTFQVSQVLRYLVIIIHAYYNKY